MTGVIAALFASTSLSTVSVSDPYFKNVALLLHGDGTNGGQNNTFIDGSANNYTITRNGTATQGSFNPYGTLWSNYFDGTGDYLTAPDNAAFQFGTGDFTVEAWINLASTVGAAFSRCEIVGNIALGSTTNWHLAVVSTSRVIEFYAENPGTVQVVSTTSINFNQWYHVAVSRTGGTLRLFLNGVQEASTADASSYKDIAYPLSIGADAVGNGEFGGYISNVRIVKGTAVYTANFTPPTSPLTAISNTSLLTCQSNRFIDNSTNNFTITRNGDVAVTNFAPFAPTSVYTTAQGASGYFSSTSYLQITGPASGTGTWTVEGWLYPTNFAAATNAIFSQGDADTTANWLLWLTSGGSIVFYSNGNIAASASGVIKINTWQHIALVSSSSNVTIYVDGVSVATGSYAGKTFNDSPFQINRGYGGVAAGNNCYISDARLVVGTAVYTAAFTPPTSPLTAITNTSLLCNFKNAAIFDSAAKNDLETVGNAQIDTTTKKFGSGSIKFDGTGDYVVQPTSNIYGYGTGDFTIEFWLYMTSVSGSQTIVSNLTSVSSTNPHLYINGTIRYYTAGADRITGASLSTGQWYHIALVRASGSTRLYIDGTQSGSTYTDSNDYGATAPLGIGTYWASGSPVTTLTLNGYIDDLRITNGVARYTANFTPPTQAFSDN